MAIGEMANDKLPKTPSRTVPPRFITKLFPGQPMWRSAWDLDRPFCAPAARRNVWECCQNTGRSQGESRGGKAGRLRPACGAYRGRHSHPARCSRTFFHAVRQRGSEFPVDRRPTEGGTGVNNRTRHTAPSQHGSTESLCTVQHAIWSERPAPHLANSRLLLAFPCRTFLVLRWPLCRTPWPVSWSSRLGSPSRMPHLS
jgi:hypothetical protein